MSLVFFSREMVPVNIYFGYTYKIYNMCDLRVTDYFLFVYMKGYIKINDSFKTIVGIISSFEMSSSPNVIFFIDVIRFMN